MRTPGESTKTAASIDGAACHATGGDLSATTVSAVRDLWTSYVPFECLPRWFNPRGGYLHNEDSPHFERAGPRQHRERISQHRAPRLRLRSQLAIELIDNKRKFSLEDVVSLKHNYRMLLADRVKPDLIKAVSSAAGAGEVKEAMALLLSNHSDLLEGLRRNPTVFATRVHQRARNRDRLLAVDMILNLAADVECGHG